MAKRGAINLSISFVVVVVLAVLILSLGVMWIQGMFESIESLTTQVIAKAKTQLMSDITSGDKDMGITLPSLTKVQPGGGQDLEVILKNTEFNARCYMIDIVLVSVDSSVSSAYTGGPDCLSPSCTGFSQIKQDAERWFMITPDTLSADSQGVVTSTVSFEITESAKGGRYGFTVYGHFMNPMIAPANCRPGLGTDQIDVNKPSKISSFQIQVSA
jgi:uncharacterized protein (UPF0333 family)